MKPQLRFKEFTDDWEEKKLGKIAEIGTGKSKSNNCKVGSYPIGSTGIIGYDDDYDYHGNFILIARVGANAGYVYHKNGNFKITDNTLYLKFSNSKILTYVYYVLINYKLNRLAFGTGQSLIKSSDLKNIKIQLPSLSEQEKIGKFFSLLDQRIEKQERKVTLLEEEKKGYMQQIFNQELRFKDKEGNDYPDWEENYISQVGEIITGNTPSKSNKNYYSEICGYPWITPSDITDKKDIETSKLYLTEEGYQKARKLPINTLLITCIASIGKNAILKQIGSCNQQINAIIPYETYSVDFLYYLLSHFSYVIELNAGQTATKIINKTDFSTLKFKIPSLPEQEKIGNFLNLLDQRIEKEQEKLRLMREEKKGLMQRMFV